MKPPPQQVSHLAPIDWPLVGFSALWILGLSLVVAALSFADYSANRSHASIRQVLRGSHYQTVLKLSGLLFTLGMLGVSRGGWERLAWAILAAAFGYETWQAARGHLRWTLNPIAWPGIRHRRGVQMLVTVLVTTALRGVLYAFTVPPWQHPDEPTHFEHVRLITDTGRLPTLDTVSLPLRREIAESMLRHDFWKGIPQPPLDDTSLTSVGYTPIGIYTLSQPGLYYVLAAVWLRPWLSLSVETQLLVVRLFSVVLNLGVIAFAFLTALALFPERADIVLGVLGFILFQPMYTDIMAAVANDALVNVLMSAFFWQVAVIYSRGLTWRTGGLALALLVGGVFSKTTALAVIAAVPFALALYPWPSKQERWVVTGVLILTGLALVLGILSLNQQGAAWSQPVVAVLRRYLRADIVGTWQNIISPESRARYYQTAIVVFDSFWAAFGWRHVLLSPGWYQALALATFAALAGLAWQSAHWIRRRGWLEGDHWRARYVLFGFSAVALAWLAAIVRTQVEQGGLRTYLSHGRYAFVAIAPFAMLFATGWLAGVPPQHRRSALWIYTLACIAFEAIAFWGYLVPYYYLRP